ncbi:hypothetical protein D9613_012034 [Agrocybe pediades]|uniref:Uncharacterized protein n=1 Tax=Agrocybe pediades TaxID=84607 RepID=A0A8H4QG37_9AGAR|nr:hypothetical protein D9613_012034 [Agrocybe pediades]
MSAVLGKAGKKLFEKHLEKYAPADPLYEEYTTDNGKTKKRKRALPPGLSKRDAKILRKLMRRAHRLDKGFSILGFRFGWTFLIGLIPVVGDFTDITLNYFMIVRPARKLDLPSWLVQRMLANNAVSAAVGFVPFVGDVILGVFKANSRNVALVEEFLRIRGENFLKMGGVVEDEPENTGWFGIGKGKGKKAQAQTQAVETTGLSKNDVEQVKPGAGMSGPEMKQSIEPEPLTTTKRATSGSGSSGFNIFGSRSKKGRNATVSRGDRGRFVEDVGPMPGSLAGPGDASVRR